MGVKVFPPKPIFISTLYRVIYTSLVFIVVEYLFCFDQKTFSFELVIL